MPGTHRWPVMGACVFDVQWAGFACRDAGVDRGGD